MKVVIAGSRTITNMALLEESIKFSVFNGKITEVVSGTAIGADQLGEAWALKNDIPVTKMPADWNKHGKGAGHIRNADMAKYGDGAIVLWDGESKGALSMIKNIKRLKKPYFINLQV